MQVEPLGIEGPLLLTPKRFGDQRGFFSESWNLRSFASALGLPDSQAPTFLQDNHSRSCQGVLRGLHYQLLPEPQGKLVRCINGDIYDVAVDLRQQSASFGQWVGAHLSDANNSQLWVPVGFAHGFLTLSESADVLYKTTGFWNRHCERSLRWDDPAIAIDWPITGLSQAFPLLAEKDSKAPGLEEAIRQGDVFA